MGTLMVVTSSPRKTSQSEAGLRISVLVIALAPTQHISDFLRAGRPRACNSHAIEFSIQDAGLERIWSE